MTRDRARRWHRLPPDAYSAAAALAATFLATAAAAPLHGAAAFAAWLAVLVTASAAAGICYDLPPCPRPRAASSSKQKQGEPPMMITTADVFYTPGEVARLCQVSPSTVTNWADTGKLQAFFRTPGGHRRFRASDVDELLKQRDIPPSQ